MAEGEGTTRMTDRSDVRFFFAAISFIALGALLASLFAVARTQDVSKTSSVAAVEKAMQGMTGTSAAPGAIDFNASPAAGFQARDPNAPPPMPGTVHQLTLHANQTPLEVAPGHKQMMWTFNGEVPGPVLRGKVGDTFEVTLVNDDPQMSHSIDFHASEVAPNVEMRSIGPGQSLQYDFVAKAAGIYMYHCGTAPVVQHVANGMYGAIIIDPPNLPPVAHEYVFVQSELYAAPPGQSANLDAIMAGQWDALMFNGYVNQYKFAPIHVDPNQRVRIWVLDAGPNEDSSFHVIGTIFDTVYKEGAYRLQPGPGEGGSQALDLMPAQGGFVELEFAEPGVYTFVTHKLSDAMKGALGQFVVGNVPADAAAGH